MGKSKPKRQVVDYYMSMHYGVCLGSPVDAITGVYVNEKNIEIATQTTNGYQDVTKPGLFGGNKEGGGVGGRIHFLLGAGSQKSPPALARRLLGLTANSPTTDEVAVDSVPGFRGYVSLFFTGKDTIFNWITQTRNGFLWGSNYPTLPPIWVRARRIPRGLEGDPVMPDTITYEEETGEKDAGNNNQPVKRTVTRTVHNVNPAHIIYECLTAKNKLAHPPALVNTASFLYAAQILRDENFGMSMQWNKQTSIESFIGEVLDHIDGTLAVDPRTGQFYLKLLRGDYDPDDIPHLISRTNAVISDLERSSWGETINEITVTWTNPVNEQEQTVTAHDDANIEIQQNIVNDSKNYYGIRNAELAMRIALRDVRRSSRALVACVATTDRDENWKLKPGDVVKLTWPEEGIISMIMRVGPVDYGQPGQPGVKLSLLEDIFGVASTEYGEQQTSWVSPGSDPALLDYLVAGASPYFIVANAFGDEEASTMEYPQTYAMLLCAQQREDIWATDYLTERPDITGNLTYFPDGSLNNQARGLLGNSLVVETRSDLYPLIEFIGADPQPGSVLMMIDPLDPTKFELVGLESSSASSLICRRGILDTVPQVWPVGTELWVINYDTGIFDARERSVGENVKYKFLPKTSRGQLPITDANIITVPIDDRQYRPYRPANVRVGGSQWGPVAATVSDVLLVTWSRRNRLTETVVALPWDDADVTPEVGQTTTIEVRKNGSLVTSVTGLTGTSYSLDLNLLGLTPGDTIELTVLSERDGLVSLQGVKYTILIATITAGYGNGYGFNYG